MSGEEAGPTTGHEVDPDAAHEAARAAGAETVEIHSIAAGGAGVGRLGDGRVVFVHRTVPGEVAHVEVVQEKRSWARGRLVEVERPGRARREAPCPLYDRCGGCVLQHLDYAEQVEAKRGIVADALERIGGLDHPPVEIGGSPSELHYRNRLTFTLRRLTRGRLVAGFHELENPRRILDVRGECLLPAPPLLQVWMGLRDAWGRLARRLPWGDEIRLTLRTSDQGVVLVVEGGAGDGDPERLVREVEGLVAIWRIDPNGSGRLLAGSAATTESWGEERFPVRANAFVQVNPEAARLLNEAILEEAGEVAGLRLIDAYSGIGTWSRALARRGARVVGIEEDPDAVEAAQIGAPKGFTVVRGRVEERLATLLPADLVLLNPPRAGIAEEVAESLLEARPSRVLYVSCDPATLARDLARLRSGYEIVRVRAFDLFPQTAHVETLVTLTATRPEPS